MPGTVSRSKIQHPTSNFQTPRSQIRDPRSAIQALAMYRELSTLRARRSHLSNRTKSETETQTPIQTHRQAEKASDADQKPRSKVTKVGDNKIKSNCCECS